MSKRHAGKTALITGASNGIGQAIAIRLAAEGARIAIADIEEPPETIDQIKRAGGEAWWSACDLADVGAIRSFSNRLLAHHKSAEIFVHSAAVQFLKPFEELSPDEWRLAQAVNQESVFHLVQAVLPGMKARQWGRIVLLTSSTFFVGAQQMTHYVTSKGALIGFAHGLSAEVGRFGVTVNCLAPGLTRTKKAVAGLPDEFFKHVAAMQSIPRSGTPEDQAGVASFLVSDDAAFVTGQTILADGGQGHT